MAKLDINMWLQRANKCQAYQDTIRQERIQAIKLYTGTYFSNPTVDSEDSEVNFVYEFVDLMLSAIYARNPYIFARATTMQRVSFAETMEKVLNYYVKEKDTKTKIKSAIRDAILQPPGFIQLGYMLVKEKNKMFEDFAKEFPELKDTKNLKVEEEQGILDETIKDDDVFMSYISSWNVLWPEGYHDIRSCPYLMVKEVTNLEDLFNNPMYKSEKYELRGASGNYRPNNKPQLYRMQDPIPNMSMASDINTDLENIKATLYHVFDRRSQQIFTIAKDFVKDTLYGPKDWQYMPDGFPIFPLIFNDVPATDEKCNSYPMSDIVPMFPQLKELSLLSTSMLKHRKRQTSVIIAEKVGITEPQAANIQNADDMTLVFVDNISKVTTLSPPPLPGDFYRLRDVILQDLLRISGFGQLLYSQRSIETATESENVKEGSRLRQSQKIDIIEEFTTNIFRYMAGLLWQFKSKKDIEEIIGEPVSEDMWPELPTLSNGEQDFEGARKIIQKELNFNIEAGSTLPPKDKAVERKQKMDLIGILKANFPNRLKEDIILQQILKDFDFKDIEKAIITNDEDEMMVAQQENQLLLQNIPQLVSPNENHQLHLQAHSQAAQPGMRSSPALDEHIMQHVTFMQAMMGMQPQKGDSKTAVPTTTPDIRRGGVPTNQDFVGATQNMRGVGGEKGGKQ